MRIVFLVCVVLTALMIMGYTMYVSKHVHIPLLKFGTNQSFKKQNAYYRDENDTVTDYVWISMGLCLSRNTQFHNKKLFPYKEAAILSSRLWLNIHFEVPVRVHMYLVHTPNDTSVDGYMARLRAEGVVVTPITTTDELCVLIAQTSRMYAYKSGVIRGRETIITGDVDAFPTSKNLLNPLKSKTPINIWQFMHAVGGTIPMCFISMDAATWEEVMDCNETIVDCVLPFKKVFSYEWGIDQSLITHQLVKKKKCFIDFTNRNNWNALRLSREPFNDSAICGHHNLPNSHYIDDTHVWTHFFPHDRNDTLYKKYSAILIKTNTTVQVKHGKHTTVF